MIRKYLYVFLSVLVLAATSANAPSAQAQSVPRKKPTGGITISPALSEIVLTPGETEKTFEFTVANNTRQPYEFGLSIVDFGSLDESGGVLFVGRADETFNYKYGLSNWATFGQDRVVVEPRSSKKIPVVIANRESLAPGGHYGAVLVTPTEAGQSTKVQINQVASALVFLKKQGGEVYGLRLHSASVAKRFAHTPDTVKLRFQNTGNVHVVPRGTIAMKDPFGRIVKQGFINADSSIVLPESFRQLNVQFEKTRATLLPGMYSVTVDYRYDGEEATRNYQLSFFYINGWYVLLALLTVVFAVIYLASARFRRTLKRLVRRAVRTVARLLPKRRSNKP